MTNHVHLLVTPQQENSIGKAMQMVGQYYVQYFNYTYERIGTLWEGRYKATLIDSEHIFSSDEVFGCGFHRGSERDKTSALLEAEYMTADLLLLSS